MPRVRDLLYRFRPAGTPGAARTAGVPADRGAETEAELQPLFALLADTDRECSDILETAARGTQAVRGSAEVRAREIVAAAADQAGAERAAAAAQLGRRGEVESRTRRAAADAEADALRRRSAEAMPAYVASVVAEAARLVGGSMQWGVDPATSQPVRGQDHER